MIKLGRISLFFHKFFPNLLLWFRLPAFVSWLGISLGIMLASQVKTDFSIAYHSELFYNVLKVSAIISLVCGLFFKRTVLRLSFFLLTGMALFILFDNNQKNLSSRLQRLSDQKIVVYGKVSSPAIPSPREISYLLSVDSTVPPNPFLTNKLIKCLGSTMVISGAHLKITGTIKPPAKRINQYDFDEYQYLLSNGISTKFTVDSVEVVKLSPDLVTEISNHFRLYVSNIINKFTDSDQRAILYAAFLGETEYLSSDIKLSFRQSGIYHLLSISGLHAAMLIGACYFLLQFLPIPLLYRHCIALGIIWIYQFFIGFIPCLFRATIMSSIVIATFLLQKKSYPIQAIGIAGTIWLILYPESLFQPGFQLSFAATFGILSLYKPINSSIQISIENPCLKFIITGILSSFYISCIGLLSTAPIILYNFGFISTFSLIANLIAVPAMSIAMYCFFLALIISAITNHIAIFPILLCKFFISVITWTANLAFYIPFSTISFNALTPEFTVIIILALTIVSTIHYDYTRITILCFIPVLLTFYFSDLLFHRYNADIDITKLYCKDVVMYAVKWPNQKIWLFVNNVNSFTSTKSAEIAKTWLRHQDFAKTSVLFISSKSRGPIEYSLENLRPIQVQVKNSGITIKDSIFLIQSSSTLVKKFIDTCRIITRNNALYCKIIRNNMIIYIPVSDSKGSLIVQKEATTLFTETEIPFTIKIKKDTPIIHDFNFD